MVDPGERDRNQVGKPENDEARKVSPLRRRVPFAAMQKEPKNRRGHGSMESLRPAASGFRSPFPRSPCLRGESAVAQAIPAGAVPSGMVSNHYHCRSAQLTKQVLLQDTMRQRGSTYTVGGDRRAATWGRLYEKQGRCHDSGGTQPPLQSLRLICNLGRSHICHCPRCSHAQASRR